MIVFPEMAHLLIKAIPPDVIVNVLAHTLDTIATLLDAGPDNVMVVVLLH